MYMQKTGQPFKVPDEAVSLTALNLRLNCSPFQTFTTILGPFIIF